MTQMLVSGVFSEGEVREWNLLEVPTTKKIIKIIYGDETERLYIIDEDGDILCSDDKGASWFEVKTGNVRELR